MWTRFYIISASSKLGDLIYLKDRLLENPRDFANVLQIYYGSQSAKKFEDLWTNHLLITLELIDDLVNGNYVGADQTEKKWYSNSSEVADFLSHINPFWKKSLLETILFGHLSLTKDQILKRINGDYYGDIGSYDLIEYQISMFADLIIHGILKQFYPCS